jgi:hypothetical protein
MVYLLAFQKVTSKSPRRALAVIYLRIGPKPMTWLLAVLKPNRIICKRTNANCSTFYLGVFLGLLNPHGQRHTSTLSIPRDNFSERKAKFNLQTSRTTQM